MASCLGSRIKLKVDDGEYSGILQALDDNYGRVTLREVTNLKTGVDLKGLLHFFRNEIHEIGVIEEKKKSRSASKDGGSKIMATKMNPAHLKKLKDVDRDKLFLTGHSSGEENHGNKNPRISGPVNGIQAHPAKKDEGETEPSDAATARKIGPYVVIDQLQDSSFREAIEHLNQQNMVGLAAKGVRIGRKGQLCWLAFNTRQYTLLLDIVSLGEECFDKGLADVLMSHRIQKVVHDCRTLSDLLAHQYNIQMVNVFDTQVAQTVIHHAGNGCWPSYVHSLHVDLFHHLQLDPSLVHVFRFRAEKEDENVWTLRPSSAEVLSALAKTVAFLRELRLVQMEKMLENFTKGVNIYLNTLREASDHEAEMQQKMPHRLPRGFSVIANQHPSSLQKNPELFDENGFFLNCAGVMDPEVKFSHDGVWHRGDGQLPTSSSIGPHELFRETRSRKRAKVKQAEQEKSRSSSGRRKSTGTPEREQSTLLHVGATEIASQRPKQEAPIAPFVLEPDDDLLLTGGPTVSLEQKSRPMSTSESEINLVASGFESKVGVPKLGQRVKDPMRKCNSSGAEAADSGGEFDIISMQAPAYLTSHVRGRLPASATPTRTSPPRADSPATRASVSPITSGRGMVLRSIEQLKLSNPKPGGLQGLQSRLPNTAVDPDTSMGDRLISGTQENSPGKVDAYGGISMGRGQLKQRYDEL